MGEFYGVHSFYMVLILHIETVDTFAAYTFQGIAGVQKTPQGCQRYCDSDNGPIQKVPFAGAMLQARHSTLRKWLDREVLTRRSR